MMKRLLDYLIKNIGDVIVLLFATVATVASFSVEEAEAYAFPQLIAVLMLVFAVVNFIRLMSVHWSKQWSDMTSPLTVVLLKKIAPGVVVVIIYLLTADIVGFYLSSWLVFFILSFLYGGTTSIKQLLLVSSAVIAVIYVMFSLVLKVQVPREFFL